MTLADKMLDEITDNDNDMQAVIDIRSHYLKECVTQHYGDDSMELFFFNDKSLLEVTRCAGCRANFKSIPPEYVSHFLDELETIIRIKHL